MPTLTILDITNLGRAIVRSLHAWPAKSHGAAAMLAAQASYDGSDVAACDRFESILDAQDDASNAHDHVARLAHYEAS